jgi:hypothetical protein
MDEVIVYQTEDNGACVLFPVLDCGLTLEEIALKDVPAGAPFFYMDRTLVPPDIEYSNAWEADFSNPDGHGMGYEAFFAARGSDE